MLRELAIRDREDLLAARELLRALARMGGCDPVVESRLVASLTDLAERFFHGAGGHMSVRLEDELLQAVLEHGHEGLHAHAYGAEVPDPGAVQASVGGARHMWDEVRLCRGERQSMKLVLRAWLR